MILYWIDAIGVAPNALSVSRFMNFAIQFVYYESLQPLSSYQEW
jgi:hypothetical protein